MIKLMFCIRKRSDIDNEAFHDYWLNEHGPLVSGLADVLKIQKYVQSHTVQPELGEATSSARGMRLAGFDGVAELWWDSMEVLQDVLATEEGQAASAALAEDEARFIDLENSTIFFVEENVIREP